MKKLLTAMIICVAMLATAAGSNVSYAKDSTHAEQRKKHKGKIKPTKKIKKHKKVKKTKKAKEISTVNN